MRTVKFLTHVTVGALAVSPALLALGGEPGYELSRTTITGGGATPAVGDGYELFGAVEHRALAGPAGNGFQLTGGFWFPIGPTDCDENGDVSLVDYAALEACFSGPSGVVEEGCQCFDVDRNGTVDLADFAQAQAAFSGP